MQKKILFISFHINEMKKEEKNSVHKNTNILLKIFNPLSK